MKYSNKIKLMLVLYGHLGSINATNTQERAVTSTKKIFTKKYSI
jgi:hypothetical protein